jgi:hypothetical protein
LIDLCARRARCVRQSDPVGQFFAHGTRSRTAPGASTIRFDGDDVGLNLAVDRAQTESIRDGGRRDIGGFA